MYLPGSGWSRYVVRVDVEVPCPQRRFADGISIGVLTRIFDRDLVDEVLVRTGAVEQRSRLLPARVVVYYVLALCLFFDDSYEEVMRKLVNGLRFLGGSMTGGCRAQARSRRPGHG